MYIWESSAFQGRRSIDPSIENRVEYRTNRLLPLRRWYDHGLKGSPAKLTRGHALCCKQERTAKEKVAQVVIRIVTHLAHTHVLLFMFVVMYGKQAFLPILEHRVWTRAMCSRRRRWVQYYKPSIVVDYDGSRIQVLQKKGLGAHRATGDRRDFDLLFNRWYANTRTVRTMLRTNIHMILSSYLLDGVERISYIQCAILPRCV